MSGGPSDASWNLALCPECERLLDACLAALTKNIEIVDDVTHEECYEATRQAEYEAAVLVLNRHRAEHGR
jgi:hypothetical protein